jgi:hypothetical protein
MWAILPSPMMMGSAKHANCLRQVLHRLIYPLRFVLRQDYGIGDAAIKCLGHHCSLTPACC